MFFGSSTGWRVFSNRGASAPSGPQNPENACRFSMILRNSGGNEAIRRATIKQLVRTMLSQSTFLFGAAWSTKNGGPFGFTAFVPKNGTVISREGK